MGLLAIPSRLRAKQTKKSGSKRSSHQVKSTFAISFQAVTNLHSGFEYRYLPTLQFILQFRYPAGLNLHFSHGGLLRSIPFLSQCGGCIKPSNVGGKDFFMTQHILNNIVKLAHLWHQQQTVYLVMCTRQLNRWSSLLPLGKNFMH